MMALNVRVRALRPGDQECGGRHGGGALTVLHVDVLPRNIVRVTWGGGIEGLPVREELVAAASKFSIIRNAQRRES